MEASDFLTILLSKNDSTLLSYLMSILLIPYLKPKITETPEIIYIHQVNIEKIIQSRGLLISDFKEKVENFYQENKKKINDYYQEYKSEINDFNTLTQYIQGIFYQPEFAESKIQIFGTPINYKNYQVPEDPPKELDLMKITSQNLEDEAFAFTFTQDLDDLNVFYYSTILNLMMTKFFTEEEFMNDSFMKANAKFTGLFSVFTHSLFSRLSNGLIIGQLIAHDKTFNDMAKGALGIKLAPFVKKMKEHKELSDDEIKEIFKIFKEPVNRFAILSRVCYLASLTPDEVAPILGQGSLEANRVASFSMGFC